MFKILKGQGFGLKLANGYTIEVKFGPLSESEHKNTSATAFNNVGMSANAEIRIYNANGKLVDVHGYEAEPGAQAGNWFYKYRSADEFAVAVAKVAAL